MTRPIRLGTRGSPLALIQTELVRADLIARRPDVVDRLVTVVIDTAGDRDRSRPIEAVGGRGIFTDALDDALFNAEIDLAVHSVKDLPAIIDRRLSLAATLRREDPREAFVSTRYRSLNELPPQPLFGSASRRREALLKRLRPDAQFTLLRGNVGDRVAALDRDTLDGTILAVAGLKRLGLAGRITQILEPHQLMPDPGQGAIGIVCRADDADSRLLALAANHAPTRAAVRAERAFLATAGFQAAIGALAQVTGDTISLSATVSMEGFEGWIDDVATGPVGDAPALGRTLALRMLDRAALSVSRSDERR